MISIKNNYEPCPLYFTYEIENKCNSNWYKINDTINNLKIQCIGRSPYKLENNSIIYDCLPNNYEILCKGIII